MTEKEKAKDKRLQKTYGITLAQYNQILELQDGKCAICGKKATDFKVNLNVDHQHLKIQIKRNEDKESCVKWFAWTDDIKHQNLPSGYGGRTKAEAIAMAKSYLMPYSIRGLLCPGRHGRAGQGCCNRLLGRVDSRDWLRSALSYIENPPARKILG